MQWLQHKKNFIRWVSQRKFKRVIATALALFLLISLLGIVKITSVEAQTLSKYDKLVQQAKEAQSKRDYVLAAEKLSDAKETISKSALLPFLKNDELLTLYEYNDRLIQEQQQNSKPSEPSPIPTPSPTPVTNRQPTQRVTTTPTPQPTPTVETNTNSTGIDWEQWRKDLEEELKNVPKPLNITETVIDGVPYNPGPQNPGTQNSPEIEDALNALRAELQRISDQAVWMEVMQGRKQKAYQDWVGANSGIYSQIMQSHYKHQLDAIKIQHGL